MNTVKNTRPDAPSVIAKLAELGVDDPNINLLTTALYEGSIEDAAVKLNRIHQWLTISAMLRGVPGLPHEELRKLHATFLDQGLSAQFLSELDAAIKSANVHRQAGEKVSISYVSLQARFYKVLAATQAKYPTVVLDDSTIAKLELECLASGDDDEFTLQTFIKKAFENKKMSLGQG